VGMITIHASEFHVWEEGEDEPRLKMQYSEDFDTADYTEDLGDWSDDSDHDENGEWHGTWIPATDVYAAAQLLTGHGNEFYASETSAEPTDGVNVWYIQETDTHVYTGKRTEKTAHLSGFTEDEQRQIYAMVMDKD
jgi:hypothetical protein